MPENFVQEEGDFGGRITEWRVDRANNGGIVFFAKCCCTSKINRVTEELEPIEPATCDAWITLLTGAKAKNVRAMESLQRSLGWDGKSLQALQETDWSAKDLQFNIGPDKNGRLRVNWINAPGSGGRKASIDELEAEWTGEPAAAKSVEDAEPVPF